MPYIEQNRREEIIIDGDTPQNEGELNYAVTYAINEYLNNNVLTYATLNQAIGVLECAKLELYRRMASPYEDEKIKSNGDVYKGAAI
jgi:hypothetical protein